MASRTATKASAVISLGSIVGSLLILFVLFPWAETKADPDAFQAPAWFLMFLLIIYRGCIGDYRPSLGRV